MPNKPGYYPDACVVHKIADLVEIPVEARIYDPAKDKQRTEDPHIQQWRREQFFQARLNRAIDEVRKIEAWNLERSRVSGRAASTSRPFSTEDVVAPLESVQNTARKLQELLVSMIGTGITQKTLAGNFLAAVLSDDAFNFWAIPPRADRPLEIWRRPRVGAICDIQIYVDQLAALSQAAELAKKRARLPLGRPPETQERPGLDVLVHRLMAASQGCGGEFFTVYKSADDVEIRWAGTLLQAVELLRPYLPKRILPNVLGPPLDRIASFFRPPRRHRKTPK